MRRATTSVIHFRGVLFLHPALPVPPENVVVKGAIGNLARPAPYSVTSRSMRCILMPNAFAISLRNMPKLRITSTAIQMPIAIQLL